MKGKDLMKIYDEDGDLFMNNIEFVKKRYRRIESKY